MGNGPWLPIVVLVQSGLHKIIIPIVMLRISKHAILDPMLFRGLNSKVMEERLVA
jgi:hypothetical protein